MGAPANRRSSGRSSSLILLLLVVLSLCGTYLWYSPTAQLWVRDIDARRWLAQLPFMGGRVELDFADALGSLTEDGVRTRYSRLALDCFREDSDFGDRACYALLARFNGVVADDIVFFFARDRLRAIRVTFPEDSHPALLERLSEDHQPPLERMFTRGGDSRRLAWVTSSGVLLSTPEPTVRQPGSLLLWEAFDAPGSDEGGPYGPWVWDEMRVRHTICTGDDYTVQYGTDALRYRDMLSDYNVRFPSAQATSLRIGGVDPLLVEDRFLWDFGRDGMLAVYIVEIRGNGTMRDVHVEDQRLLGMWTIGRRLVVEFSEPLQVSRRFTLTPFQFDRNGVFWKKDGAMVGPYRVETSDGRMQLTETRADTLCAAGGTLETRLTFSRLAR